MKDAWKQRVLRVVALLDTQFASLLNRVIHHAHFQALESRWRNLSQLVSQVPIHAKQKINVRLLCLSEEALKRDLDFSSDPEQTQLFSKIYTQEYDYPGGQPFGLLIADYVIHLLDDANWIDRLAMLSQIAAAAFSPILIQPNAAFFELKHFNELSDALDLPRTFSQAQYQRWWQLRAQEEMRFLYCVLPDTLLRLPHADFGERVEQESDYLWGSSCYLIAAMIINTFLRTGWFNQLLSVEMEAQNSTYFSMDRTKLHPRGVLRVTISAQMEQVLSEFGFISVLQDKFTSKLQLRSCYSMQKTPSHVSSMLSYVLCASRFAHYLKIIGRDRVGCFDSAEQCQQYLQDWIFRYCGRAGSYPLANAHVQVLERQQSPGQYICRMEIKPHYHIEKLKATLRFVSVLGRL